MIGSTNLPLIQHPSSLRLHVKPDNLVKMSTAHQQPGGFASKMSYIANNTVSRFIITFLVLHSVHYATACAYASWCLDMSFWGYFKSVFSGHGPVCHALMMIAYHAQHNIYTLLGTAAVGAGITWLTEKIIPSTPKRVHSD